MPISLAEIELNSIQNIKTDETQALVKHRIPGLQGDIIQYLGRHPTRISFEGIFKGDEALDHIEKLRQKFKAREPIAFVSDITDSTDVTEVVIENLRIWEIGGRPNNYAYTILIKEFVRVTEEEVAGQIEGEQEKEAAQANIENEEQIENKEGTIEVRVELEEGEIDYSGISVLLEGTTNEGEELSIAIDKEENGIFLADNLPAGTYTATVISEGE